MAAAPLPGLGWTPGTLVIGRCGTAMPLLWPLLLPLWLAIAGWLSPLVKQACRPAPQPWACQQLAQAAESRFASRIDPCASWCWTFKTTRQPQEQCNEVTPPGRMGHKMTRRSASISCINEPDVHFWMPASVQNLHGTPHLDVADGCQITAIVLWCILPWPSLAGRPVVALLLHMRACEATQSSEKGSLTRRRFRTVIFAWAPHPTFSMAS